jgi:hypothetical protein
VAAAERLALDAAGQPHLVVIPDRLGRNAAQERCPLRRIKNIHTRLSRK